MSWYRRRAAALLVLAAVLVAACEKERPRAGFADVEEAAPVPAAVIKRDSSLTPEGYRVAELHVLLPSGTEEAAARATLQHVIDSVSAADTMAAAVRVTGFVMESVDPAKGTADVVPAIRATWGPIDSTGFIGAQRTSRYRTEYLLLRPFESRGTTGQTP